MFRFRVCRWGFLKFENVLGIPVSGNPKVCILRRTEYKIWSVDLHRPGGFRAHGAMAAAALLIAPAKPKARKPTLRS